MWNWFLLAFFFGGLTLLAPVTEAALFEDRTESVGWVETTYNGYDSREPIYTVGPVGGDGTTCYLVSAQYEISNTDPKHSIMVGQTIIRHRDSADTRGVRVLPAATTNVDRARYHEHFNASIVDCPPVGDWYYSLNVYSGLRKQIPTAIRVEQGYGFLQAYRLPSWQDPL